MTRRDAIVLRWRVWRARRRSEERGALSAALPIIAFALLVLAGLGIDGSRQLNTRGQAVAYAEEAARDGALGIDPSEDELTLIPAVVQQRVGDYCAFILRTEDQVRTCNLVGIVRGTDKDGQPETKPLVVHVEVTTSIRPTLLAMVYNKDLTAKGEGYARPTEGIETRLR